MVSYEKWPYDMQQNPQMNRQLDLFDREERAAILEHDAGYCRQAADKTAGVKVDWLGGHEYLARMIADREPLIHLVGANPNTCRALSFASYEPEIARQRAWVQRGRASNMLANAGYQHHCTVRGGQSGVVDTWRIG